MGHNTTNDRIKSILEEMWHELGEDGRRKWINRAKSTD